VFLFSARTVIPDEQEKWTRFSLSHCPTICLERCVNLVLGKGLITVNEFPYRMTGFIS